MPEAVELVSHRLLKLRVVTKPQDSARRDAERNPLTGRKSLLLLTGVENQAIGPSQKVAVPIHMVDGGHINPKRAWSKTYKPYASGRLVYRR